MFKLSNLILNPKKAKRHPFEIILIAFFYTSISLLLSLWIFPEYASIFTVFLTVIACLYMVQGTLILEERKEKNINSEKWLLKQHSKLLMFFLFLFIGFLFAFIFWTIVLPEATVTTAFSVQKYAHEDIRSITANAVYPGALQKILFNNLRVLILSLFLAIFYGAGAIFVLVWNASIMGFVIGELIKNIGLTSLPYVLLKFFLHGIPEILAYFAGALAGSILFISIIKSDLNKDRLKRILIDVSILTLISISLLVIAALIEVYVYPII